MRRGVRNRRPQQCVTLPDASVMPQQNARNRQLSMPNGTGSTRHVCSVSGGRNSTVERSGICADVARRDAQKWKVLSVAAVVMERGRHTLIERSKARYSFTRVRIGGAKAVSRVFFEIRPQKPSRRRRVCGMVADWNKPCVVEGALPGVRKGHCARCPPAKQCTFPGYS